MILLEGGWALGVPGLPRRLLPEVRETVGGRARSGDQADGVPAEAAAAADGSSAALTMFNASPG
jgi:hypothetical protein